MLGVMISKLLTGHWRKVIKAVGVLPVRISLKIATLFNWLRNFTSSNWYFLSWGSWGLKIGGTLLITIEKSWSETIFCSF